MISLTNNVNFTSGADIYTTEQDMNEAIGTLDKKVVHDNHDGSIEVNHTSVVPADKNDVTQALNQANSYTDAGLAKKADLSVVSPLLNGLTHAGADLNTETTTGVFRSDTAVTNGPFIDNSYIGWVVNVINGGTVIYQTAFKLSGKKASRTYWLGSGWGPWRGSDGGSLDCTDAFYNYGHGTSRSDAIHWQKEGRLVTFWGALTPVNTIGSSAITTMFKIPTDLFTIQDEQFQLCQGSNDAVWLASIQTDNIVSVSRYRSTSGSDMDMNNGAWLPFTFTVVIA